MPVRACLMGLELEVNGLQGMGRVLRRIGHGINVRLCLCEKGVPPRHHLRLHSSPLQADPPARNSWQARSGKHCQTCLSGSNGRARHPPSRADKPAIRTHNSAFSEAEQSRPASFWGRLVRSHSTEHSRPPSCYIEDCTLSISTNPSSLAPPPASWGAGANFLPANFVLLLQVPVCTWAEVRVTGRGRLFSSSVKEGTNQRRHLQKHFSRSMALTSAWPQRIAFPSNFGDAGTSLQSAGVTLEYGHTLVLSTTAD